MTLAKTNLRGMCARRKCSCQRVCRIDLNRGSAGWTDLYIYTNLRICPPRVASVLAFYRANGNVSKCENFEYISRSTSSRSFPFAVPGLLPRNGSLSFGYVLGENAHMHKRYIRWFYNYIHRFSPCSLVTHSRRSQTEIMGPKRRRWQPKLPSSRVRNQRRDPFLSLPSSTDTRSGPSSRTHTPRITPTTPLDIPQSSPHPPLLHSVPSVDSIDDDEYENRDTEGRSLKGGAGSPPQPSPHESRESGDATDSENNQVTEGKSGTDKPVLPLHWTTMTSLLAQTGTKRLTDDAYDMFASHMNWLTADIASVQSILRALDTSSLPPETASTLQTFLERHEGYTSLPGSRSIRRRLRPAARAHAFVSSEIRSFPVDASKSGSRGGVGRFQSFSTAPVMLVKPSTWAKQDMSTHTIRALMTGQPRTWHGTSGISSIEQAPIVMQRERVLEGYRVPRRGGGYTFLERGVQLEVRMRKSSGVLNKLEQSPLRLGIHEGSEHVSVKCFVSSVQVSKSLDADLRTRSEGVHRAKRQRVGHNSSPPFRAADVVVHLSANPPSEEGTEHGTRSPYLVFRFWTRPGMLEDYRTSLLLLDRDASPNDADIRRNMFSRYPVADVVSIDSRRALDSPSTSAPCRGKLADGRPYVVYRFLLYCDGFLPYAGRKGSMGGCYLLPLGVRPDVRARIGCLRRIALTPPGVSTNHILEAIIPDIVEGTAHGFPALDADGNETVIFLDCVGFIADYPAVSEALDVLGHMSNAPCHACAFRRYDRSGQGHSKYGYTADIHNGHPSFSRTGERTAILRELNIPEEDLHRLGMQREGSSRHRLHPLHALSVALSGARARVPRTSDGVPVVPAMFDPYRSCIVAPDHLFLGMSQDAINCVLRHLPPRARRIAHHLTKKALVENDLLQQNEIFDVAAMEVHSMSISAMYSVLLVTPTCFKVAWAQFKSMEGAGSESNVTDMAISLLSRLQKLVSSTQALPIPSLDGWESSEKEWQNAGLHRLHALQESASEYIKELDNLCKMSEKARKCLDKPNVHRLLELYHLSLPAFGTVHLIQELVLERGHQELKRGVTHSNFKNPQLQAMEHALGNDWVCRLGTELQDVHMDGNGWSTATFRSVLRLLGHRQWELSIPGTVQKQVQQAFPPPVMASIRRQHLSMSSLVHTTYSWVVPRSACRGIGNSNIHFQFTDEDLTDLETFLVERANADRISTRPLFAPETPSDVSVERYAEAHWTVTHGHVQPATTGILKLRVGDVIQKVTALPMQTRRHPSEIQVDEEVLNVTEPCQLAYWRVISIFGVKHGDDRSRLYTAVVHCELDNNGLLILPLTGTPRIVLPLTARVRRVMLIHNCSNECRIKEDFSVTHSVSSTGGDRYFPFGRADGYPSRSS